MAAPMDFNVHYCEKKDLIHKLIIAHKHGYKVVAINNELPDLLNSQKVSGKKKQDKKVQIAHPDEVKVPEAELAQALGVTRKPLRQLARISTLLTATSQSHVLDTPAIQNYDLIAVQPTTDKTFHQACTSLKVDIVTIDVYNRLGYRIKRTTLNRAIERGLHFEIQYCPGIRDKTLRKSFISNAMALVFWCKGKNVILSSGCEKPMEMRGPKDVAQLGLLFNLTEAQANDAVTRNCRAVLGHSESRRIVKSVMDVQKVTDIDQKDSWVLDKLKVGDCENNDEPKHSESSSSGDSEEEGTSDGEHMEEPPIKKTKNSDT